MSPLGYLPLFLLCTFSNQVLNVHRVPCAEAVVPKTWLAGHQTEQGAASLWCVKAGGEQNECDWGSPEGLLAGGIFELKSGGSEGG